MLQLTWSGLIAKERDRGPIGMEIRIVMWQVEKLPYVPAWNAFSCESKLLVLVIVHDLGRLNSGGPHVKLLRSYATMFIDLRLLLHSVLSTRLSCSGLIWDRGQETGWPSDSGK